MQRQGEEFTSSIPPRDLERERERETHVLADVKG